MNSVGSVVLDGSRQSGHTLESTGSFLPIEFHYRVSPSLAPVTSTQFLCFILLLLFSNSSVPNFTVLREASLWSLLGSLVQ